MIRFPEIITAEWLIEKGACTSGLVRFRDKFPRGALPGFASFMHFEPSELSWLTRHLPPNMWEAINRRAAYYYTFGNIRLREAWAASIAVEIGVLNKVAWERHMRSPRFPEARPYTICYRPRGKT